MPRRTRLARREEKKQVQENVAQPQYTNYPHAAKARFFNLLKSFIRTKRRESLATTSPQKEKLRRRIKQKSVGA